MYLPDPVTDSLGFRLAWTQLDDVARQRYQWPNNLDYANLSDLDLSNTDLSGRSMYGIDLAKAQVDNTDFSHSDLRSATAQGAFYKENLPNLDNARTDYGLKFSHLFQMQSAIKTKEGELSVLAGDVGSGKTRLAIREALLHVAQKQRVFYISNEMASGILMDVYADYAKAHDIDPSLKFIKFIELGDNPADLTNLSKQLNTIAEQMSEPTFIVLDTHFSQAFRDERAFFIFLHSLVRANPCIKILLTRTRVRDGRVISASAMKGAVDQVYMINRDQDQLKLEVFKDDEHASTHRYEFDIPTGKLS